MGSMMLKLFSKIDFKLVRNCLLNWNLLRENRCANLLLLFSTELEWNPDILRWKNPFSTPYVRPNKYLKFEHMYPVSSCSWLVGIWKMTVFDPSIIIPHHFSLQFLMYTDLADLWYINWVKWSFLGCIWEKL